MPHLFLGDAKAAMDLESLKAHNISAVVNCAASETLTHQVRWFFLGHDAGAAMHRRGVVFLCTLMPAPLVFFFGESPPCRWQGCYPSSWEYLGFDAKDAPDYDLLGVHFDAVQAFLDAAQASGRSVRCFAPGSAAAMKCTCSNVGAPDPSLSRC
jgi:hypothetical protein